MFRFPCSFCQARLSVNGKVGQKARCPGCKKLSRLISEDDDEIRETFPVVNWSVCDDGRSSKAHCKLSKCGIKKTSYYLIDDPILAGWWAARRVGIRPCRCTTINVDKWDAQSLGLRLANAGAISFDPWSSDDDCELMGWGSPRMEGYPTDWADSFYMTHSGNPDLKEAKLLSKKILKELEPGGPGQRAHNIDVDGVFEQIMMAGAYSGLWKMSGSGTEDSPYLYFR